MPSGTAGRDLRLVSMAPEYYRLTTLQRRSTPSCALHAPLAPDTFSGMSIDTATFRVRFQDTVDRPLRIVAYARVVSPVDGRSSRYMNTVHMKAGQLMAQYRCVR